MFYQDTPFDEESDRILEIVKKLNKIHLQELGAVEMILEKDLELKNKGREFEEHCTLAMEVAAKLGY